VSSQKKKLQEPLTDWSIGKNAQQQIHASEHEQAMVNWSDEGEPPEELKILPRISKYCDFLC
jgi:hypothetical protein